MKYRLRPPTIDAEQWSGPGATVAGVGFDNELDAYVVMTPNGNVILAPGDYVITDANGNMWPNEKASFEKMYEPAT